MPTRDSAAAELVACLEGLPEPHILLDGTCSIAAANAAYRRPSARCWRWWRGSGRRRPRCGCGANRAPARNWWRAVHEASPRTGRPRVVVDCASLAESLFESELFGHEKGAFTGAHAARPGLVEAASGGTQFLDEVGDIPPAIQVKLLRLLESGSFRRVGSTELRQADLRVVAATHRDLRALIVQGRFREDLYHRLATAPIRPRAAQRKTGQMLEHLTR